MITPIKTITARLKARSFVRSQKGIRNPYDLSDSQIAALRDLQGHPAWPEYADLLDSLANLAAEEMLLRGSSEELNFLRGHITGIRRAGVVIEEITQEVQGEHERRRNRDESLGQRDDLRALFATFGSRFYEPSKSRRDGV